LRPILTAEMTYDDEHDEFEDDEELDDSDAFVRSTNGYVGDAEALLRRAVDIIASAPTMPLSSSPRIDRDEIIELLEESLHRLPEEMRQARWMIKERQEFVAKTRREADELLEAARVQAERMVQRTEVVRAAEQRARQISEAADALAEDGIHAEVIDVATLKPLDFDTIRESVQKTGRCVIVHEAPRTAGFGAEIAARVAEECLYELVAPVERVTGYDTHIPLYRLEMKYLPSVEKIVAAAQRALAAS